MKQFAELIPIILFFLTYSIDGTTVSLAGWEYHFDGFYSATAVLMIATTVQLVLTRLITGHVAKRLLWISAAVLVFGAATLALHNPLFLQWKTTLVLWAMALALAAVRWRTHESASKQLMGADVQLPAEVWLRVDRLWIGAPLVFGALNLIVAYQFSEAIWVRYKLISVIVLIVIQFAGTLALMAPHLRETDDPPGHA